MPMPPVASPEADSNGSPQTTHASRTVKPRAKIGPRWQRGQRHSNPSISSAGKDARTFICLYVGKRMHVASIVPDCTPPCPRHDPEGRSACQHRSRHVHATIRRGAARASIDRDQRDLCKPWHRSSQDRSTAARAAPFRRIPHRPPHRSRPTRFMQTVAWIEPQRHVLRPFYGTVGVTAGAAVTAGVAAVAVAAIGTGAGASTGAGVRYTNRMAKSSVASSNAASNPPTSERRRSL